MVSNGDDGVDYCQPEAVVRRSRSVPCFGDIFSLGIVLVVDPK